VDACRSARALLGGRRAAPRTRQQAPSGWRIDGSDAHPPPPEGARRLARARARRRGALLREPRRHRRRRACPRARAPAHARAVPGGRRGRARRRALRRRAGAGRAGRRGGRRRPDARRARGPEPCAARDPAEGAAGGARQGVGLDARPTGRASETPSPNCAASSLVSLPVAPFARLWFWLAASERCPGAPCLLGAAFARPRDARCSRGAPGAGPPVPGLGGAGGGGAADRRAAGALLPLLQPACARAP